MERERVEAQSAHFKSQSEKAHHLPHPEKATKGNNKNPLAGVYLNNDSEHKADAGVAAAVPSSLDLSETEAKPRENNNFDPSLPSRRKSNRDVNSIRLSGVGKTAHTFYRRMHSLFFSNSSREEYEALFINGSRRRKRRENNVSTGSDFRPRINTNISGVNSISIATTSTDSPKQVEGKIQVQRVTKPEEACIYVIDNFLTEKELEYFDEKIRSIPFERSFVDNMRYNNENHDYNDDEQNCDEDNIIYSGDGTDAKGILDGKKKEGKDPTITFQIKKQTSSIDKTNEAEIASSGNRENQISVKDEEMKKKIVKKRKKRERKTLIDDSHRTSTFYSFRKLHDRKISGLERRIANMLGCWVHQIEALQLVRYVPGQFFGIHHDLGNLLADDSVELPRKDWACKRRLVTIFCYLNTLKEDEGGCTYFPKCSHLRIKPKRGRAVLWCNITQDGKPDPKTIHAGEAVKMNSTNVTSSDNRFATKNEKATNGSDRSIGKNASIESISKANVVTTKYGLNIWVCEE